VYDVRFSPMSMRSGAISFEELLAVVFDFTFARTVWFVSQMAEN
jgi:hypothetical protein